MVHLRKVEEIEEMIKIRSNRNPSGEGHTKQNSFTHRIGQAEERVSKLKPENMRRHRWRGNIHWQKREIM